MFTVDTEVAELNSMSCLLSFPNVAMNAKSVLPDLGPTRKSFLIIGWSDSAIFDLFMLNLIIFCKNCVKIIH